MLNYECLNPLFVCHFLPSPLRIMNPDDFKKTDRVVTETTFLTHKCKDCGFNSGRYKWTEKEVIGAFHLFKEHTEEVDKTTCPECTRADSIRRAQETFNKKVEASLAAEKETLRRMKEQEQEPRGTDEDIPAAKRQKAGAGASVTRPKVPDAEMKGPDKCVDVRWQTMEHLMWDPVRCALVKVDDKGQPTAEFQVIPPSQVGDPTELKLNFDPARVK